MRLCPMIVRRQAVVLRRQSALRLCPVGFAVEEVRKGKSDVIDDRRDPFLRRSSCGGYGHHRRPVVAVSSVVMPRRYDTWVQAAPGRRIARGKSAEGLERDASVHRVHGETLWTMAPHCSNGRRAHGTQLPLRLPERKRQGAGRLMPYGHSRTERKCRSLMLPHDMLSWRAAHSIPWLRCRVVWRDLGLVRLRLGGSCCALADAQQLPLVKDLVCSILRACILCRCASESGGVQLIPLASSKHSRRTRVHIHCRKCNTVQSTVLLSAKWTGRQRSFVEYRKHLKDAVLLRQASALGMASEPSLV
jgi:hypothetical protein